MDSPQGFEAGRPRLRTSWKDILLGIDVYTDVLLHGRRSGSPGSPIAFEGWVLARRTNSHTSVCLSIATHHISVTSTDDLLRKFWEIEKSPNLSPDERLVVQHTHPLRQWPVHCASTKETSIQVTWRVKISSCETTSITRTFIVLERSIPRILHCNGGILQDEPC